MPRLDNFHPYVVMALDIDSYDEDPEQTPPADICRNCDVFFPDSVARIGHPPYADQNLREYTCSNCGEPLEAQDD